MVGEGFEQSQHSISVIPNSNQPSNSVDTDIHVSDENMPSISTTTTNDQ